LWLRVVLIEKGATSANHGDDGVFVVTARKRREQNQTEQNSDKIQQRNSKQQTTTATNANWISAHRDYYNL
jgi:hypothetical protein